MVIDTKNSAGGFVRTSMAKKKITENPSRSRSLVMALVVAFSNCFYLPAYALGLGDIKALSGLGQGFAAYVEVHVSPDEDPASISVSGAGMERYHQGGLVYPLMVGSIKMKTVQQNDRWYALLQSDEAIVDPLVTIILRGASDRGYVTRQYDVLLDPSEINLEHVSRNDSENFLGGAYVSGEILPKRKIWTRQVRSVRVTAGSCGSYLLKYRRGLRKCNGQKRNSGVRKVAALPRPHRQLKSPTAGSVPFR